MATAALSGRGAAEGSGTYNSHANRLPVRSVLRRVVEQIEDDLPDCVAIEIRDGTVFDVRDDAHSARRCERKKRLDGFTHDRSRVDAPRRDAQFAALAARELQDVLDEIAEAAGLLIDDAERALALFVGADAIEQQRLREHADLGERSAQFVRDAGDEIGAHARERALAAELQDRGDEQRAADGEEHDVDRQRARDAAGDDEVGGIGCERRVDEDAAHQAFAIAGNADGDIGGDRTARGEEHASSRIDGARAHFVVRDFSVRERARKQRADLNRQLEERREGEAIHFEAIDRAVRDRVGEDAIADVERLLIRHRRRMRKQRIERWLQRRQFAARSQHVVLVAERREHDARVAFLLVRLRGIHQ